MRTHPAIRGATTHELRYSSRRLCPGRHFAQATIAIALASILHVFDVGPPLDADGAPIVVVPATTDGVLSYVPLSLPHDGRGTRLTVLPVRRARRLSRYPADCRYTIKPRSKEAVSLIRAHSAVV